MMHKKIVITIIGSIVAFTSVFALSVFAEQQANDLEKHESNAMKKTIGKGPINAIEAALNRLEKFETKDFQARVDNAPATLAINPKGHVKITNGKVAAVNGDIIMVEIWKINFSVHKMTDTKVLVGRLKEFVWDQIKVGDIVDVLGDLDTAQTMFIHAQVVHDRTQLVQARDEEAGRMRKLINDLIRRLNEILTKQGKAPLPTITPTDSPSPSPSASPSPSPSLSASPSPSPSPSAS